MERLAVALITATHGIKGYVKIKSLSGESAHLLRLKSLYVRVGDEFHPFAVEEVRGAGRSLIMKLAGIDNPEQADRYRGCEVWVERGHASPLAAGEYYLADLCRCRVSRGAQELGRVVSVWEGGLSELLEVEDAAGHRFLVPFSEAFVGEIDVGGRRIEVKEGFEIP